MGKVVVVLRVLHVDGIVVMIQKLQVEVMYMAVAVAVVSPTEVIKLVVLVVQVT